MALSNLQATTSALEQIISLIVGKHPEIDVIFLVDGSSSITTEQWIVIQFATRELSHRFPLNGDDRCRVALIQFSNTAKIECDFTSHRNVLHQTIDKMKQIKSSTMTADGLRKCEHLFSNHNKNCYRLLILLTDGDSDTNSNPIPVATEMKNHTSPIDIITIGIGNDVNKNQIQSVASNIHKSFFLDSMDELQEMFTIMATFNAEKPTLRILKRYSREIVVELISSSTAEEFEIEMFHSAFGWKKVSTVKVADMKQPNTIHEISGLNPNTQLQFRARATLASKSYGPYSDSVPCTTMKEDEIVRLMHDYESLQDTVNKLISKIKSWSVQDESILTEIANLVIFGRIGTGKSTFINGCFSALMGQPVQLANTDQQEHSVTRKLRKYVDLSCKFNLMDTFGWQIDNYKYEIPMILKGNIGQGYVEGQSIDPMYKKNPTMGDAVHGVIIFYAIFSADNPKEIEKLKAIRKTLIENDIQPITVLSKLDLLDPTLIEHPERAYESDIIHAWKTLFMKNTGVPDREIFLSIGRTQDVDEHASAALNYMALSPVWRLLSEHVPGRFNVLKLEQECSDTQSNNNNSPHNSPSKITSPIDKPKTTPLSSPSTPSRTNPVLKDQIGSPSDNDSWTLFLRPFDKSIDSSVDTGSDWDEFYLEPDSRTYQGLQQAIVDHLETNKSIASIRKLVGTSKSFVRKDENVRRLGNGAKLEYELA